ncbi:hypothetical protein M427DRAFT_157967 [Gonapodya prolifera JEL478]|uniref:Uncharacterized protein n=1 Tax=Gonapodya prolifera (strain JEL478) TaxID=1344416 RepID=A0A139A4R2_GONPJ|nr:hypothetical protein M427DRAFT_157967 [Gonapodya prolifera JEL478]|eukprot:KXS11761.1 hypothetical protein M427DRAFT_157967 [Gonapodya prolifera JEL478]
MMRLDSHNVKGRVPSGSAASPVEDASKQGTPDEDKQRKMSRIAFKREYYTRRDRERWDKMASERQKELDISRRKAERQNALVDRPQYNPVTLSIHGPGLEEEDAKALERISLRAATLYLRNNTYDPIRGVDVPRDLSYSNDKVKSVVPSSFHVGK